MFGDPVLNPKGWPEGELGNYISFQTSGSRGWAKYYADDGELFITIKNVKNGVISTDDVQHIHAPNDAEANRTKVQEGDLLISITADLGRTGVVSKELAERGAYINQHLTCLRLDRTRVNPIYAAHFFESAAGKMQFEAKNNAAVKAGLNFNAIRTLRFVAPPLNLQNSFVEFLAQLDKSLFWQPIRPDTDGARA